MRPLTEDESRVFLEKLSRYVGRNAAALVSRSDAPHAFRLHRDRVFYVREALLRLAENVPRDKLCALGTCLGKFTKSGKFRLHVTALDHISAHARCRLWLKPTAEMSYLYGNHVLKAHVARMTEDIGEHEGVVVMSTGDIPLGFAVSAKSAAMCVKLDPTAMFAFHQADIGEYLRDEQTLI